MIKIHAGGLWDYTSLLHLIHFKSFLIIFLLRIRNKMDLKWIKMD